MIKLRPLIVLTGAIHISGGDTSERRDIEDAGNDVPPVEGQAQRLMVILKRTVTADRRRGTVRAVHHSRKLRKLRLYKCPLGTLIDPQALPELKAALVAIVKDIAEYNKTSTTCRLDNCYVWEPLAGNRKAAFEGWISRRLAEGDPEVTQALAHIIEPAVVSSEAPAAAPAISEPEPEPSSAS